MAPRSGRVSALTSWTHRRRILSVIGITLTRRLLILQALTLGSAGVFASAEDAQMDFSPRPLQRLAPGAFSESNLPEGYSHIVMIAWPRLDPAGKEAAPGMAARFAEMFGTVILAEVAPPTAEKGHTLRRLAIGHLIRDGEQVKIVNAQSPELSFVGRQVLASGERELAKVQQIARYETAILFETPAVIRRGESHREMTLRQFIWTSSQQGGLASLLWLVDDSQPGAPRVVDDHFVQLPAAFHDDRRLSVDPTQFNMLGVPGRTAFALARLPQGVRVQFTQRLAGLAAMPSYDQTTLPQLAAELARAVAAHSTQTAGH